MNELRIFRQSGCVLKRERKMLHLDLEDAEEIGRGWVKWPTNDLNELDDFLEEYRYSIWQRGCTSQIVAMEKREHTWLIVKVYDGPYTKKKD